MGTRNLTMVISDKQMKVAQYGQWDGYPEGQGKTVCKFIRFLNKPGNLKAFKDKLKMVTFMDDADHAEMDVWCKSIGAEILFKLNEISSATKLHNSVDFAGESLFCEWAYLLDLNKKKLEVYIGFNKKPLTKKDRFEYLTERKEETDKYFPIKLLKSYKFSELPPLRQFCRELNNLARKDD